jgi:Protein of unknown function (DUF1579)
MKEERMDTPKPTADHKRLEKLAGIWIGTEKMHPSPWDPKGSEAQAITRSRVVVGGYAVAGDYEQRSGANITFEGHAVYTWDPKVNQVVLHWFDSMGGGVDVFRGGWNGDKLELQCQNVMGSWRMTTDLSKPGVMTSHMGNSSDGPCCRRRTANPASFPGWR